MNPKVAKIVDKLKHTIVIKDPKVGEMEWEIRPLPAHTLLENLEVFNKLSKKTKNFDSENLTDDDQDIIKNQIVPVMNAILPNCSLDPPVTLDAADPRLATKDALHIKDLTFKQMMGLFTEIMKISGLDEETEDERKKLQSQTSVNP